MKIKGIDVSTWNGAPDWGKVKADGIEFAILRAGYGREASQKDRQFDRNYTECKTKGMPIGIYWYNYAKTPEDAAKEATACLEVIKGKQFEYPVFYDIEEPSVASTGKENVKSIARTFLNKIKEAGYKVGIYCGQYFASGAVLELAKEFDVWMPDYRANAAQYHYEDKFAMWQHSSTGKVIGINGNVDMNWCYKDYLKENKPTTEPVKPAEKPVKPSTSVATKKIDTYYRVFTGMWWNEIKNTNDVDSMGYAGVEKLPIYGLAAKVSEGKLRYRVHVTSGKWFDWVTGYNIGDWNNGIAGYPGYKIDGIQMELVGVPGYQVQYRSSLVKDSKYLSWITGYGEGSMGYSGIYGSAIDKVQIRIVKV